MSELAPKVHSRAALLDGGWTERKLTKSVRDGILHHIRRDAYVAADDWNSLWPEERHRMHVVAAARDARGGSVMSYTSAAVLHGLPLYRHPFDRLHVTVASSQRGSSSRDVMRHVEPLVS